MPSATSSASSTTPPLSAALASRSFHPLAPLPPAAPPAAAAAALRVPLSGALSSAKLSMAPWSARTAPRTE